MDGTIDPNVNYLSRLSSDCADRWPILTQAAFSAIEVRKLLIRELSSLISEDVDLVAFGSLARGEWTSGSDVDWTLLIDGQASPDHRELSRQAAKAISSLDYLGSSLQPPGSEGIFGNMAFSHDIIHHIGGQIDSNRNTTQRILLLLESIPLREESELKNVGAYERVIRNILNRYLIDDTNFYSHEPREYRIPRFLLNDVVRYWRTMCVDFAYKEWEQAGEKWALRNLKLRMSRKLLFLSGLFTVFSCFRNPKLKSDSNSTKSSLVSNSYLSHLQQYVRATPGNIVAWTLSQLELNDEARALFDSYEQFLAQLNSREVRNHLEGLHPASIYEDKIFLNLRQISHEFQRVLQQIVFERETELKEFIISYGVF